MTDLLEEVMQHGTGASAGARLKHPLGGKTGTTNDFTDAWFVGFSPSLTAGVWMGFDDKGRSLGNKESGGVAALPLWIDFMQAAVKKHPNEEFPAPPPEDPALRAARP